MGLLNKEENWDKQTGEVIEKTRNFHLVGNDESLIKEHTMNEITHKDYIDAQFRFYEKRIDDRLDRMEEYNKTIIEDIRQETRAGRRHIIATIISCAIAIIGFLAASFSIFDSGAGVNDRIKAEVSTQTAEMRETLQDIQATLKELKQNK